MNESDAIAVIAVAAAWVKVTGLVLRYRAGQRAADRKTAKKQP